MSQMHPVTLELLAKAHRADLVAQARNDRLVREARQIGQPSDRDAQRPVLSVIRASRTRIAAVVLASALALGAVAGAAVGSNTSNDPAAGPAPAAPASGGGGGGAGRPLLR